MTPYLGGIPKKLNLSALSDYILKDPRFALNSAVINEIKMQERKISETPMYFIPTDKIKLVIKKFQPGDIIGFVPYKNNIDVTHVAIFAGIQPNISQATFIHASSSAGKVLFDSLGLISYLNKFQKNLSGIVIFRCSLNSNLF